MKEYLGDSVYVEKDKDSDGVILTTDNGEPSGHSNTIYLDSAVIMHLHRFLSNIGAIE